MNYRTFMKNSKAISPIFATLILIAIAVIAGVVVYMFTSGTLATMTNGGTAGQEKITVQAASYSASGGYVSVYLEQTAGPAATVNGLIVKDGSGNTITSATNISPATALTTGVLTQVMGNATLSSGTYTITTVTKAGGSFVSTQFTVP